MNTHPEIGRRPVKAIIIVYLIFNILTSSLFLYFLSLDKNLRGDRFSLLFNTVFRSQTVSIVGAIVAIGWFMFFFYLFQIFIAKRRRTPHRPFKF